MALPTAIPGATVNWSAGAERLFFEHTQILNVDTQLAIVKAVEAKCHDEFLDEPKENQMVIMRFVRDEIQRVLGTALIACRRQDQQPTPLLNSLTQGRAQKGQ